MKNEIYIENMRELKKRLHYIYYNKFCLYICIISLFLALTQLYNFIHFDDVTYIVRGTGLFLIPIACFFFYEKGMLIYGCVMATCFLYLTDFNNYTSLWFILTCNKAAKSKKDSLIVYVWYSLNSLIYFTFCQSSVTQAFFHLGFAAFMTILNYHCNGSHTTHKKHLSLTPDEFKILWQITAEGKQQKEITLFSQTTITQKIRDAQNRNNLPSKTALFVYFVLDNDLDITTLIQSKD